MLERELAEREPGSLGRTPTLYSASPTAQEILTHLVDIIFGDILRDDPTYLKIAHRQLGQRLAQAKKRSSKG